MHYIIILTSFVVSVACLPVSYILDINQDGKDISSIRQHHPYKYLLKRHRRSIWVKCLNHMAAAVELLQMKPLLAEGINDVESFDKIIKNEFPKTPKSENAMFKKSTKDEENLESKKEKPKTKAVNEEEAETLKFYAWVAKIRTQAIDQIELEFRNLAGLKKIADRSEKKSIRFLDETEKALKPADAKFLYDNGINHVDSEVILERLFDKKDDLEFKTASDMTYALELHEEMTEVIQDLEKKLTSETEISEEQRKVFQDRLKYFKQSNDKWLHGY